MWYNAWQEMLQGVQLVMSQAECHGGADGLMMGILSCSSSGSTMGSVQDIDKGVVAVF
jgi:hypothetical protein